MERDPFKFSLILATVGRTEELARFLEHLDRQTYRHFELIIVDQNLDEILGPLVRQYQKRFPLLHLRSEKGLSRARNVGLQCVSGDFIAFPDDDCWYAPDTLEMVARAFSEDTTCDGLIGRWVEEDRLAKRRFFSGQNGWVNKRNVWRRSVSISIFLRAIVISRVGLFDEALGAGSGHGKDSGEETDYLIRAIDLGFRIYYCREICIFHPYPENNYGRDLIKKGYRYSVGWGHVLRKHRYPFWFVCYCWTRSLAGVLVSLLTFNFPKSRYHFAVLKGRVLGWLG